ncbi:hypothetical protein FPV67DRAFT_1652325 [Lyophyllum atratum]|nr:hypothetical protein FPV67DRAFT_1652325 [Lyophyllum atratum]
MSTILVEQRLPIIVQLISRVPAYAQVIASVIALFIFWLCPSMAPKLPVRQIRAKQISIHSLNSTTSTFVDTASKNAEESNDSKDVGEELVDRTPIKFSNPFSKLAAPVKVMMSPSLARVRPYARRMSLPARRFTEHFATTIATPFHHRRDSLNLGADSYFVPHTCTKVEDKVEVEVTVVEAEVDVSVVEQDAGVPDALAQSSNKKATKFKRMTKKVKALLRIRRRL